MDEQERANRILQILRNKFNLPHCPNASSEPFPTLIRTVLSQATNDKNSAQAYKNLSENYQIDPQNLASADIEEIEKAIWIGGLYRNKSKKIKKLSKAILDRFNGSLDFIFSHSLETARELLMEIPGVGPKTADVVLLFCARKSTIPVDTHVNRVSRRLGLAPFKNGYENIRRSLEELYLPKDYLNVHLLLITLGRNYCKSRNPRHRLCPVNFLCPTWQPSIAKSKRARSQKQIRVPQNFVQGSI